VPRGEVQQSHFAKYLSCPTFLLRPIESQEIISRLSHRNAWRPANPVVDSECRVYPGNM
jgi:hypothetical protein